MTQQNVNFTPEQTKVFEARLRQSYFVGQFRVVTVPLEKRGYSVNDGEDKFIFVSSKLPKAERTEVVKWLIQKRSKNEEAK